MALQEYEKGICENPDNLSLQENFFSLAKIGLGETQANLELFLIYRKIQKYPQADSILQNIVSSKKSVEATSYFEKKLENEYDLQNRISIYYGLAYLNPNNPLFFDELGRLYLGTGQTSLAITALSRSIETGNRKQETINYLVRAYIQDKRYQDATTLVKKLLDEKENPKLRKTLAEIYKKSGNKELYLAEIQKIKEEKKPLIAFKKPEIQKPSFEKKLPVPEKIILSSKIDVQPFTFLVVDKSLQKLSVYQFDGIEIKKLVQFECTTGKNMEDKKRPGDLATPEGTFLIKSFIPGEKLDPKYGAGAFVLDFPDYLSKRQKKDGSGIWLHATPIERPPYNSEGCVVVNDKNFLELERFIEPGKTYIHIVKQEKDIQFSELSNVWETISRWKESWESLDTDRYLSFYSENFRSDGKDKKTWSEYKKRVNKDKNFVRIDIKEPVILPYGNTEFGYVFIVDFIQRYESNNMKSTTEKSLYLVKQDNTYKILGELVK